MSYRQITSWKIVKEIKRGAIADVYSVEVESNQGKFTCLGKFIRKIQSADTADTDVKTQLDDCVDQLQYLHHLNHPNLVNVFDIKPLYDQNMILVFMEMINNGEPLAEILKQKQKQKGQLDEKSIQHYAKQICEALAYLHDPERNVLHRNICSDSVMITKDNVVKLSDHDISIQLLGAAQSSSEGSGEGPLHYRAPELFTIETQVGPDGTRCSRESDIWAFGCVIYEMATGMKPHNEFRNQLAVGRKVLRDGAPELPTRLSSELKSFYRACTAKDRSGRKQAKDLLSHDFMKKVF